VHRAVSLLVIAVSFVLALTACTGGDQLSLEEYFERVDELDQTRADEIDRLNDELDALPLNDVSGGLEILQRQTDAREAFADGLDELDEPDEIQGLHQGAVNAWRRAVEEFRGFAEENQDAQTVLELLTGFAGVDFEAISAALDQCNELEAYATRNGISVDLSCQ
jgi:hypothetical protein